MRRGVYAVLVMLALGCAHRVEISNLPSDTEAVQPPVIAIGTSAILEKLELRINGNSIEPPEELRRQVVQKIKRTSVFQEVVTPADSGSIQEREKAVALGVFINGVLETQQMANLFRSVFFFLSPEPPNKDRFDVTILMQVIRSDKAERRYRSRIQGVASYRLFGGEDAKQEAQDQVLTWGLNDIMRQLMRDVDFFAGNTP